MSTDETAILDYLKQNSRAYVPVDAIASEAGEGKDFGTDRNWLLAILRRMEIEEWIETDGQGNYRFKPRSDETTSFMKALETPGVPLGDTAIITIEDVGEPERQEAV